MRWLNKSALIVLSVGLLLFGVGCASASHYSDSYPSYEPHGDESYGGYAELESDARRSESAPMPMASADSVSTRAKRSAGRGAPPNQQQGPPSAPRDGAAPPVEAPQPEHEPEVAQRQTPLLIYTGVIVLGIFDVSQTQEKAIAIIEETGGFIATRTRDRLVMRVPAEHFRSVLDELTAIGDVIDLSWQAADVSEQVRDLDIRLQNSLEVRRRLQDLLERAEKVEDALAIEAQLERITLEIERIVGQLRSFEDRIRYSTIEIHFRPKRTEQVAQRDYVLPFRWLNELGVERLMRLPEVGR